MSMRYCQNCVLPDTRPGIRIGDDGICNACTGHSLKSTTIDWQARATELAEIVDWAKSRNAAYDCIVPVSGGKDSMWQVAKALEMGLRVLAVTWKTPGRTPLGQQNLDALIRLGVDHHDVSINPRTEAAFMLKTLRETGSSAVPMHLAIFAIPMRMAAQLTVPLILWGESPIMEYGGDDENTDLNKLNHAWMQRHGILQGRTAESWADEDLPPADLAPYIPPAEEALDKADIKSIFLGYYMPWDPAESLRVAAENGFQRRAEGPKLGLYDYADIDCDFISIHHWFKWVKFGCTRLFDNLSLEIRNGRLTRAEAINVIGELGDQRPTEDIEKACAFMGISIEEFAEIEESFRNRDVWTRSGTEWVINDFLVPNWDWSAGRARNEAAE